VAKVLCLPYYACVFSSTKFVIRAEQDLPGTEVGGRDSGGGQRGKMTQTIYAHVNK
jgi:small ligand-binding sensory domain FIST